MRNIGEYLKQGRIFQQGRAEREEIRQVIRQVIGVDIPLRAIEIRNNTAFIRASGSVKMEIILRKAAILEALGNYLKQGMIQDII